MDKLNKKKVVQHTACEQGSHASWKVLESAGFFLLKIWEPEKT